MAAASALLLIVAAFTRSDPVAEGLNATYFADAGWSSTPVARTVDLEPSSAHFARAWSGAAPDAFSATWSGGLVVLRRGIYTFATESDDGSWLYVDGQLVVDNGGIHSTLRRTGTITLASGDHELFVEYFQSGGGAHLEVLWSRGGSAFEAIPSWALISRHAAWRHLLAVSLARRARPAVLLIWLAAVAVALGAAARPLARRWSVRRRAREWQTPMAIVGMSIVLTATGIWWGVPSEWAGDEIAPRTVSYAIDRGFSGGWFDRYPPFHMEVLALVFSPWLVLRSAGFFRVGGATEYGVLMVVSRIVSVVAAAGTIVTVYRIGRQAFSPRAGVFAAAALAVLTPFLYYGKTANPEVPYVFWFMLSVWFYVRLVTTVALSDFVGFALSGILAICTKDQAYGLYLVAPLLLIRRLWRWHRDAGAASPFRAALTDRRIWIPFAAACGTFVIVHNIIVNPWGFLAHVRDIVGPGNQSYQMVAATATGQFELMRIAVELNRRSWGWPFWVTSLGGLTIALADRHSRNIAVALLLCAASYYVGFVAVVRYAFDRYLLPICVAQALFIGVAFDTLLRRTSADLRRAAGVGIGAAFAYTALYAATLDILMVRDTRYGAEWWLRQRTASHNIVGFVFPPTVVPRLQQLNAVNIGTAEDLAAVKPEFFILNADYARATRPTAPEASLIAGLRQGTLGYRLAFRSERTVPWRWLPAGHPNLVGARDEVPVLSVLTEVSPTIEIFARDAGRPIH